MSGAVSTPPRMGRMSRAVSRRVRRAGRMRLLVCEGAGAQVLKKRKRKRAEMVSQARMESRSCGTLTLRKTAKGSER